MTTPPPEEDPEVAKAVLKIGKPLDLEGYRRTVETILEARDQIALRELLETHAVREGAVDLVAYLCVAADDARHLIDEQATDQIDLNRPEQPRFGTLNRIIFQRQ